MWAVANYVKLLKEEGLGPSCSCGRLGREPDLADAGLPDGTVIRAVASAERRGDDSEGCSGLDFSKLFRYAVGSKNQKVLSRSRSLMYLGFQVNGPEQKGRRVREAMVR
jgi:hypothetical protein